MKLCTVGLAFGLVAFISVGQARTAQAAALRAVTLDAAEILGVADRVGSTEAGKDAGLVIRKDHPIST